MTNGQTDRRTDGRDLFHRALFDQRRASNIDISWLGTPTSLNNNSDIFNNKEVTPSNDCQVTEIEKCINQHSSQVALMNLKT